MIISNLVLGDKRYSFLGLVPCIEVSKLLSPSSVGCELIDSLPSQRTAIAPIKILPPSKQARSSWVSLLKLAAKESNAETELSKRYLAILVSTRMFTIEYPSGVPKPVAVLLKLLVKKTVMVLY